MTASDVFLSYNRKDAAIAKLFAEALARERLEVWWDQTLRSGETYDEVTEAAFPEPAIDRLPGTKMDRQHPPATSRTDQVANPIDHLPEIHLARPASAPGLGHQERNPLPFLIGQIARIALRLLGNLGHPTTALLGPHPERESCGYPLGNPIPEFPNRWGGCRPPQTASRCARIVVLKATEREGRQP
jgi:hypothetical protein